MMTLRCEKAEGMQDMAGLLCFDFNGTVRMDKPAYPL
jgi:hypothetical protein